MVRTDLVVPARLVPGLRVPSLSVTTGGTEVEWVEIPTGRWAYARRPAQRLPLDPAGARLARRHLRFGPWILSAKLAALLSLTVIDLVRPSASLFPVRVVVCLAIIASSLSRFSGLLPRQSPRRTAAGDLRIPRVPIEVAERWAELNPGVFTTDVPAPRPHSRRWYATWATALLVAAAGLFTVFANNGREDSLLIWVAVLGLFVAGVATALKTLPPGFIRFDEP